MANPSIQVLDIPTLENHLVGFIGKPRFDLWFKTRVTFQQEHDMVLVLVPNNHFLEWINSKFRKDIEKSIKEVMFKPLPVVFQINNSSLGGQGSVVSCPENLNNGLNSGKSLAGNPLVPLKGLSLSSDSLAGLLGHSSQPVSKEIKKKEWLDFKSFVVGESNRLSYELAKSISLERRCDCNPLVVFGPPGCGKSHLLEAAYRSFKNTSPLILAEFISAEEFTSQYVAAMMKNRIPAFRSKIRANALFIFDDIHLLADKPKTQKEFMLNLDVITQKGGSVIVSMDCHPRLTKKIMPELLDRLMAGMISSVDVPEDQLRIALIKRYWSLLSSQELNLEVVLYLCKEIRGNVRIILGVLKQISNFVRINRVMPDMELARFIISGFISCVFKKVELQDIDEMVSSFFNLPALVLRATLREEKLSLPRNIAMYVARKITSFTYREIGNYFGNRNHSTVIASEKKIEFLLKQNPRVSYGNQDYDLNFLLTSLQQKLQNGKP